MMNRLQLGLAIAVHDLRIDVIIGCRHSVNRVGRRRLGMQVGSGESAH